MRVVRFAGPGSVEVVDLPNEAPPPGWVRVAVSAVGICGSDLHMYHGDGIDNRGIRPGHEFSGVVDAVGDGVDLPIGARVTAEPLIGCGTCVACTTGRPNRCRAFRVFGVHAPGGLADYVNVPSELVVTLPETVDATVGALAEPMAVCCRGIRRAGAVFGARVAVLGAGSVGLMAIVAACEAGASEVHVTARYPHQAELARALGATAVFDDGRALRDALGREHVDVTVETVGGGAATLTEAVKITRSGGTIVVLGIFEGAPGLPAYEFVTRELSLVGSNCYAHDAPCTDFKTAVGIVDRHRAEIGALVTHRFALDEAGRAFETANDKRSGAVKVQLTV